MRNKQDIAVLNFFSVSLREIHSVKLRVVKIIKYSVSRRDTELIVTCYLFFPTKHNKYFSNANYANNRKFISITNDRYRGSYKNDFCANLRNLRNLRSKKYLLATQVVFVIKSN